MFLRFCQQHKLVSVPASDDTLLLFITYLHNRSLSFNTIKVYLSSIITLHNMLGSVPPNKKNPRIKLALRAISLKSPEPSQKDPITFKVLLSIWQVIDRLPEYRCIKAAIALGFFGGLRGAEYLRAKFNPGPAIHQVKFNVGQSNVMTYRVLKSKTKPHGFTLPLACSKHDICAVCCMTNYLQHRQSCSHMNDSDPLFMYQGLELTKCKLSAILKDLLLSIGLLPTQYSLHSLRSGVATTAANCNFKDWELKMLGGWESNTYMSYIRPTNTARTTFPRRLVNVK